jgi:hypothetical protein
MPEKGKTLGFTMGGCHCERFTCTNMPAVKGASQDELKDEIERRYHFVGFASDRPKKLTKIQEGTFRDGVTHQVYSIEVWNVRLPNSDAPQGAPVKSPPCEVHLN